MSSDPSDMLRDDLEKFQQYQNQDQDTDLPAIIELTFMLLTSMTVLVWFVAIYWVPDPIDSGVWIGMGGLGLILFGVPAGIIYGLRRGGAEIIAAIVREYVG